MLERLRRLGGPSNFSVAEDAERGWISEDVRTPEELLRSDVLSGNKCLSLVSMRWTFRSPRATSSFA